MERRSQQSRQKKKRILLMNGAAMTVLCAILFVGYTIYSNKIKKEQSDLELVVANYEKVLSEQDFSSYIQLFADESFETYGSTKEEITQRYQAIFGGIGTKTLNFDAVRIKKNKSGEITFSYQLVVATQSGSFTTDDYQLVLEPKENGYRMAWDPDLIFPGMSEKDTVQFNVDEVIRGDILDRNGKKLAENYDYQQLGVNPSKLGTDTQKQESLELISEKYDISMAVIEDKLAQKWAKGDTFVPLKTLETTISHLEIADLPTGVLIGYTNKRHYPLGEATAHLLGYVGKVTAEDIKDKPYLTENDSIGRSGLEAAYDAQLRGRDGVSIVIVDEKKRTKQTLLKKEKVDAVDLKLTIDGQAQQIAFDSLKGKPATIVVSEPKTGQLLAAVSSPSFDPNKMVLGISEKEYQTYADNEDLPFMTRFTNRYAPGSTFKTITAAIGLDSGDITSTETLQINGLKWQKDASWGGFWTTRVKDTPNVDLKKALVYSDNIYFAQKALGMGENTFRNGLNRFIFGEKLDLPLVIESASISNEEKFCSEILLADTAYGQGELMIAPITQLTMYSVFMNDGSIVYPQLLQGKEVKLKKEVISEHAAKTVLTDLIDSVVSPDGYVYSLYNPNYTLAAKTGTAEIKEKQDTLGKENSFLLFFDAQNQRFMGLILSENARENGTAVEKAASIVDYLEETY
ncbi:penicillin-binding transpeptidase domain-containing protein [Enterococcus casseliflavus]|uniref:penicillin-binding protein PBP4(5) n=1 Tax=Enterococcus casseliflavus TaxID=37734 RepID=UPI001432CD9B|nr:penicillin-binding transpeptidase domain-containing protein [Enterococcus casseliflavus]NKD31622.1 penicillin-binding transpeptidase domain-containing protein [Enterococcus casseliflavus]